MRRFLTVATLYVGVLVIAFVAAVGGERPVQPGAATRAPRGDDLEFTTALEPFDGCADLLSYFKTQGRKRVGPYGLSQSFPHVMEHAVDADASAAGGTRTSGAGAAAAVPGTQRRTANKGDPAVSGTNVQEAGIDEPDIVKTDGRRLVAVSGNVLNVFDIDADGVRRRGSLRLDGALGSELLLDGDRVLVLSHNEGGGGPQPLPGPDVSLPKDGRVVAAPISRLSVVDISDPADPQVASSLTLDGNYVSARMVDGVARVVVRSQPVALEFVMPKGGGLRAERRATRRNREVVAQSELADWLPYAVLTDATTGSETERPLVDCEAVSHPDEFAGFGMVTVLSVDVGADLQTQGAAAVVGDADTVYASTDNLYLSLHRWSDESLDRSRAVGPPDDPTTQLHQFDIRDPSGAHYVASGTVEGRLLNQWALSEHDGVLRVATTLDDLRNGRSSSSVVILRQRGETLDEVGRVDGLGKGEQIYAVRYDGDIGYVVTFRQTDPLYTLDLSDATDPRVRGELKINGYSAYLHPVGDGRILGIGQDATRTGQITGSQASLFDVRRLARPERIDQVFLGHGSSNVEHDHRAFLYWPDTSTAVVPLQTWTRRAFNGVVVLRVDDDRLVRKGTIRHTKRVRQRPSDAGAQGQTASFWGGGPTIVRSLVVDDALVTVSEDGILVSDLENLAPRDWARFTR